jgi:hypothetical protein
VNPVQFHLNTHLSATELTWLLGKQLTMNFQSKSLVKSDLRLMIKVLSRQPAHPMEIFHQLMC